MSPASDAVVVGGGPAGAFAAWNLAKLGVNVSVFEEHDEIGVPSHCAGHMSIRGLKALGLETFPKGVVENTYAGANFHSAEGTRFSIRLRKPVTYAVNRALFDKFLADKAAKTGAQFFLNSRVGSLLSKSGVVAGVNVERDAEKMQYETKVVLDCEGISSRLVRQAGLAGLDRNELVYGVEAEMENVKDVTSDQVEVYLGNEYAQGLYAWLMPKSDGTAKVGLASKRGNPRELFQRFMSKHPVASKQLSKARVKRMAFHPISLGGPLRRTFASGFVAVGDAASQVKPTTGGGVVFGLTCAKIAAEVVAEAVGKEDATSNFLQLYQNRCNSRLGFDFRTMLRARKLLNSLPDKRIDDALQFCQRFKVGEALSDVDEIDLQGQTLLKTLTKPAAFAGLAYLLLLYFDCKSLKPESII